MISAIVGYYHNRLLIIVLFLRFINRWQLCTNVTSSCSGSYGCCHRRLALKCSRPAGCSRPMLTARLQNCAKMQPAPMH